MDLGGFRSNHVGDAPGAGAASGAAAELCGTGPVIRCGEAVARACADDMTGRPGHQPVLLAPMLDLLAVRPGGRYLDATFGGGGHSRAILEAGAGQVIALDRDPEAIARAEAMAAGGAAVVPIHGTFGMMDTLLEAAGVMPVDGIVLDLGVSSFQLDQPERGFALAQDGPLDMRMDRTAGPSAAEIVNQADEATLADLLLRYGEERQARRIARAIVRRRQERPLRTTRELADLVGAVVGRGTGRIDPATRTFQALRIRVNDELGELERGLAAAERLLAAGGRLVVVAFHSLEDRQVKRFLNERSGEVAGPSRHRPPAPPPRAPTFRVLTRRPVRPDEDEVRANPRARSARLRAALRLASGGDAR